MQECCIERIQDNLNNSTLSTFNFKNNCLSTEKVVNLSVSQLKSKYEFLIVDENPLDYWILSDQIGCGIYSSIFKAQNKDTGLWAAVKIIENCEIEELDDFLFEAKVLNECKHRNIIEFYEAYYFDESLWILIELCSGGSIESFLSNENSSLSEKEIKYILAETLQALTYLHDSCKIIHRDIKSSNILLTSNGDIKLADFGVSARPNQLCDKFDGRCSFIGSPFWMSPEILREDNSSQANNSHHDYKTDIWSLCISAIEMAFKEPPNNDLDPLGNTQDIEELENRINNLDIIDLFESYSSLDSWSKGFLNFISACLEIDPVKRPSASDLLKVFDLIFFPIILELIFVLLIKASLFGPKNLINAFFRKD